MPTFWRFCKNTRMREGADVENKDRTMSRRRRRRRNKEETVMIQGTEVPKSQAKKVVWIALGFAGFGFLVMLACTAMLVSAAR